MSAITILQILRQFLQQLSAAPHSFPYKLLFHSSSSRKCGSSWVPAAPWAPGRLSQHALQAPVPLTCHTHPCWNQQPNTGCLEQLGRNLQAAASRVGEAPRLGEGFSSFSSKPCLWQSKTNLMCVIQTFTANSEQLQPLYFTAFARGEWKKNRSLFVHTRFLSSDLKQNSAVCTLRLMYLGRRVKSHFFPVAQFQIQAANVSGSQSKLKTHHTNTVLTDIPFF